MLRTSAKSSAPHLLEIVEELLKYSLAIVAVKTAFRRNVTTSQRESGIAALLVD
jgi:hypothetical protein